MVETDFSQRVGFHYFPDSLHYRQTDLATWLPRLEGLRAAWLVLRSEMGRAIPEAFLKGLLQANIQPVVQLAQSPETVFDPRELRLLLETYAHWGVRFVLLMERPNSRTAWPSRGWVQQDLVRRFLDRFVPPATLCAQLGLTPIFPPLEPGGSYWDTAFLQSALSSIAERQQEILLHSLALSAYAWTGGHDLSWGAGGPARWQQARPYHTPPGSQDQRGFRIFEWYQAIAQPILQHSAPFFLFQAGSPCDPAGLRVPDAATYSHECLTIARLLAGEQVPDQPPLPREVVAGCFWLLAAAPGSPHAAQAWFGLGNAGTPEERPGVPEEQLAAAALRAWQAGRCVAQSQGPTDASHPIAHYLLLPGYTWGVPDWYLETARPFIQKHRPTVGFSLEEARLAKRVTVVGQVQGFTSQTLTDLRRSGCQAEWIEGDGTTIATLLAER